MCVYVYMCVSVYICVRVSLFLSPHFQVSAPIIGLVTHVLICGTLGVLINSKCQLTSFYINQRLRSLLLQKFRLKSCKSPLYVLHIPMSQGFTVEE